MKALFNAPMIVLLGSLSLGSFSAMADVEVSATVRVYSTADFDVPLRSHGAWIEVGRHGRCWRPAQVAVSWKPYSVGQWVWTECGWYWQSDEPWAWACYHYGSWVYDSAHGWVWVPGTEWAPAWVSWRVGSGYIGWAPSVPSGVVVTAPMFVFVESHRFHHPIKPLAGVVNNTATFKKTIATGGIKRETRSLAGAARRRVVINEGPDLDLVEKATHQKFTSVPIREVPRPSSIARPSSRPELSSSSPRSSSPRASEPLGPANNSKGKPEGKRGGKDKK